MKKLLICYLLIVLVGCSGDSTEKPNTVKVSGRITLNNQPLKNAEIHFMTDAFASVGVTDDDGNYSLIQGAIPGENRVYITTVSRSSQSSEADIEDGLDAGQLEAQNAADPAGVKALKKGEKLPPKYSDPDKTILTWNVPDDGEKDVNFDLKTSK